MALSHQRQGGTDMTVGSPYRHIMNFALPILISQIFQQLYNTADSLIVGHFLGTEALAAVSSSGTLIFLMISFFTGASMGAGVVISRYFGANDHDQVSKAIHTNVAYGLVSGLLLTVLGIAFTPTMLVWMNTPEAVLPQAIEYFQCYFAGALSIVMYNTLRATMNAVGDSRRPLYYLIFSSILNIGLDVLFVGYFRWGVWAAALATIISQMASVVLCLAHLLKKGNVYSVEVKKLGFDWPILKEMLRLGLPAGVQNSVIAIANVLVQTHINSYDVGTTAFHSAAFGAHSKIEGFAFLPINSFNMAITTFISQNLGAKQFDRAKQGARFGIWCGVAMAALIGIGEYIFSPQLISLFDNTPEVIALGVQQSRIASLFYFLLAYSHSIASVCRGAGKAIVPMCIMLAVWCVFRIIYITVMDHFFHEIRFIYWAYPITWSISSVIYFLYYHFSDWVHGFEKKEATA